MAQIPTGETTQDADYSKMLQQSASGESKSNSDTRMLFCAFTLLLAIGTLFHQALATEWQLFSLDTPLALAALYAMLRPGSLTGFWILIGCHLADLLVDLPFVTNHVMMQGIVELAAILSLALLAISRDRTPSDSAALYRMLAPMLRIVVILMYGFAALAKMNTGFLDPNLSSAVALLDNVLTKFPIIPQFDWMAGPSILGTILLEAALPLFLLFHRTRLATVFVALFFHAAMGLSGHVSYSGLAPALLLPFVPNDLPSRLRLLCVENPNIRRLAERVRAASGSLWAFPTLAFLWLLITTLHTTGVLTDGMMAFALHSGVGAKMLLYPYLGLLVIVLALCTAQGRPFSYRVGYFRLLHPACAVIPLLMILNGLSPYLGLKTQNSLTMFSNLQTEGNQWNHILLPEAMRIFDFQTDLVELVDSSDSMLSRHAKSRKRWVFFEFHRYLSQHPEVSVTFDHAGERRRVDRVGDDPVLSQPPGFALRKVLWFRTVSRPGANGHRF